MYVYIVTKFVCYWMLVYYIFLVYFLKSSLCPTIADCMKLGSQTTPSEEFW